MTSPAGCGRSGTGWLAAALLGLSAPAAASPAIKVSASSLLAIAEQLKDAGRVDQAAAVFRALFADPSPEIRVEARFRLAMLEKNRRRNVQAALLLRQILDERPNAQRARLELAGVLNRLGDDEGARRMLRDARAGILPPEVARLVDRFSAALRARKPTGATIEIAFAPDSNINRATSSDTLGTVLGDFHIARSGKARSGIGLALRGQAYRRLALGDSGINLLGRISGSGDLYRHSAFNQQALDITAGPEFHLGRTSLTLGVGATANWFGGALYTRQLHAGADVARPIGPTSLVRLHAAAAGINNRFNGLQDGRDYSLQLSGEQAIATGTGLVATLNGDRFAARDPGYATSGWRVGLHGWHEIGRSTLLAGVEIGALRADQRLRLFPATRADRYLGANVGLVMRQLARGGLAPLLRVTVERNRSSIALYDYHRVRTEVGLARAF